GRNTKVSPRGRMACWPWVLTVTVFGARGFGLLAPADADLFRPAHPDASNPRMAHAPSSRVLIMPKTSPQAPIVAALWLEGNPAHLVPGNSQPRPRILCPTGPSFLDSTELSGYAGPSNGLDDPIRGGD